MFSLILSLISRCGGSNPTLDTGRLNPMPKLCYFYKSFTYHMFHYLVRENTTILVFPYRFSLSSKSYLSIHPCLFNKERKKYFFFKNPKKINFSPPDFKKIFYKAFPLWFIGSNAKVPYGGGVFKTPSASLIFLGGLKIIEF